MIYTMMSCVDIKYLLLRVKKKKKTHQNNQPTKNQTQLLLHCQETCCTCLYILADKDQMRQEMKWLTKSEGYLRHPKAHLVNLRKLLTQN